MRPRAQPGPAVPGGVGDAECWQAIRIGGGSLNRVIVRQFLQRQGQVNQCFDQGQRVRDRGGDDRCWLGVPAIGDMQSTRSGRVRVLAPR